MVVTIIAIIATVGVYGIVADCSWTGLKLIKVNTMKQFTNKLGNVLVQALPKIIKSLSVIGTILLLVAGGIFVHEIPLPTSTSYPHRICNWTCSWFASFRDCNRIQDHWQK
jgi:predicted DNA repair protein MutK